MDKNSNDINVIENVIIIMGNMLDNIKIYDMYIEEDLIRCKTELLKLELIHNDTINELSNLLLFNKNK